jgi:hypothetical protein
MIEIFLFDCIEKGKHGNQVFVISQELCTSRSTMYESLVHIFFIRNSESLVSDLKMWTSGGIIPSYIQDDDWLYGNNQEFTCLNMVIIKNSHVSIRW